MSLYNMLNGVNPATFYILPILGKHPDSYPRFRDCFVGELTNSKDEVDMFGIPVKKVSGEKLISVYTRVGGGNRDGYEAEIEELRSMKGYVKDYDDDFDSTFATFVFKVPEDYETDYDLILENRLAETSKKYQKLLVKVYPKLKSEFKEIFKNVKTSS